MPKREKPMSADEIVAHYKGYRKGWWTGIIVGSVVSTSVSIGLASHFMSRHLNQMSNPLPAPAPQNPEPENKLEDADTKKDAMAAGLSNDAVRTWMALQARAGRSKSA